MSIIRDLEDVKQQLAEMDARIKTMEAGYAALAMRLAAVEARPMYPIQYYPGGITGSTGATATTSSIVNPFVPSWFNISQ